MSDGGSNENQGDFRLPRGLIVLCCLWIAVSWITLFGVRPPVQPVSPSYSDDVMMMAVLTMLGITIGWPLLRTSGPTFRAPLPQTCLDVIVIACAIQVVFWPLRLVTNWSVPQTAVIVLDITLWVILYGAIVWLGAGSASHRLRTSAMAIATIISLGGLLLARDQGLPWWSPVSSARFLTEGVMNDPRDTGLAMTIPLSVAATGLWALLAGIRSLGVRSGG